MIPILDNGHGGVELGIYQTKGKRSPNWDKGVLYEGMFNRWVVNRVMERLDRLNIPYGHVSPELKDTPLKERVRRLNEIYRDRQDVYLLSIHANAGGGQGIEGFTSKGHTKSDAIADVFLRRLEANRVDTSDGDLDKESNLYVLKHSYSPAVLLELGFMDNKKDYDKLWNEGYLYRVVDLIVKSIIELYEG